MKYTIQSPKFLFDNLKDGDFFATYHKQWYYLLSKLIAFVTGEKVSHIICVYDVERESESVSFRIAEMVPGQGNKKTSYSILKEGDNYEITGDRFQKLELYHLKNRYILNDQQSRDLAKFHSGKVEYHFSEYALTLNWFAKLFAKKNKNYTNVCSTYAIHSMFKIGIEDQKIDDRAVDPVEFVKSDFIETITKIDANITPY